VIAFLADAVLAVAFIASIAAACLVGLIAERVSTRFPYHDMSEEDYR
jgi:hypothetical protein